MKNKADAKADAKADRIAKKVEPEADTRGDGHREISLGKSKTLSPKMPLEDTDPKSRPCYSDEVMLKLVNLLYDPLATDLIKEAGITADEAHLMSLTRINSSKEAWFWAQQIAKEAAYNKYGKGHICSWPISRIQRVAFLLARRSIPGSCGPGFMLGVGLAQEQNIVKAEEAGEENEW